MQTTEFQFYVTNSFINVDNTLQKNRHHCIQPDCFDEVRCIQRCSAEFLALIMARKPVH